MTMQTGTLGLLGAIIAGGRSRRFGSDKALAEIGGRPMLDHVVGVLRRQTDALVICGREWRGLPMLDDRPGGTIGPLAGLNAALHHAALKGFDAILSVPVDVMPLPERLAAMLAGTGAAVFRTQHLIGRWPATLAPLLDAYLAEGGRTLNGWIERAGARRVDEPPGLANINFREDLDRLRD